jgi:predicted nucleic acid-binding protein
MKQINLFLITLVVVMAFIIWTQTNKYRNINNDVSILRIRNDSLIKENKKIDSVIANNNNYINNIIKEKEIIDSNHLLLIKRTLKTERELKLIKGKYKNLTNDSLLISLKKAYEIDSIIHINK